MKKGYLAFLLIAILAILVSGCEKAEPKKYHVGFSQCANDEWRIKMNEDMKREALFYDDIDLEISSAGGDNHKQIEDIRNFIRKKIDLLIISPNEAVAITPIVEEAYSAGIPIIVVDRKVMTDSYTAFIGADNYKIGQAVGQYISGNLSRGGNVVELTGLMGSTPGMERHQGFIGMIKQRPDIRILCSEDAKWDTESAYSIMLQVLAKYRRIDYVYAHNDIMAYGAYMAAKSVGREKEMRFVGIDALTGKGGGVELVSDGILDATFIYPSGVDQVMKEANDILRGINVPRETILSTALVDKSNVKVMQMQAASISEKEQRIGLLNNKINTYLINYSNQRMLLYLSLAVLAIIIALLLVVTFLLRSKNKLNAKLVETNSSINEQKQQLERQRDQLILLSRQVEEATQAKLVFFTNISHEFRTPLTLIADPTDRLLSDSTLDGNQKSLLLLIKRNVDILLRLVNQILDFRKFEDDKLPLNISSFDLASAVKSWNDSFVPMLGKKHIKFLVNSAPDAENVIEADFNKMEQVYYNLLSNAFKYTPENGTIEVSISSASRDGKPFACLVVHNSGSFIDASNIAHIFDRFYQSDPNNMGSGIGLTIVKAFVELHGGYVLADSRMDKGTTFSVYLPAKFISRETEGESKMLSEKKVFPADEPEEHQEYDSSKPSILVIDDNADIRNYISQLYAGNFFVLEAENGEDGIRKAIQYVPDIIILDVMMPGMSGMECCKVLKGELQTCHIPIIMLTAWAMDEKRIESYRLGADSFIAKPFKSELLTARIDNLLENRARMQSDVVEERADAGNGMVEMDRKFIDKMKRYIIDNMSNPNLDIDSLSEQMALSRTQLYRKVKMLTNYSPNEYIRFLRLRKAMQFLSTSSLNINEICYETGFSSPSYFSKCYKEQFGELPSDYKKRIK